MTFYFKETTGLCNHIDKDMEKKLCFFELDTHDLDQMIRVKETYDKYHLDYIIHKTKNGFHFLSPTIVTKSFWLEFLKELKDLNEECPMICLRIQGNKYPNEQDYFYKAFTYNNTDGTRNSIDCCNLLNKIFGTTLKGSVKGDIEIVRYKPHIEIQEIK